MPSARGVAARVRHRAWLAGWAGKDRLAGITRRVADGAVALTFDDGPHPLVTGQILDVLADLGVPATFFFVGRNAAAHPDLVARAVAEGHAVGSHSMTHPHPARMGTAELTRDYRAGRRAVSDAAGREVALFRPPHGHFGFVSAAVTGRQALSPWLWTVDPEDWRPGVTAAEVVRVAGAAGSGDVVLMHDRVEQPTAPEALDRSATVQALPAVVRTLQARGVRFTSLPA